METRYNHLCERLRHRWDILRTHHRQRGQTMVEFAIILPIFLLMMVGMIYGGIMLMDYHTAERAAGDCATACGMYGNQSDATNLTNLKDTKLIIYSVVADETDITRDTTNKKVTAKLVMQRGEVPLLVEFFINEKVTFKQDAPIINQ